MRTNVRSFIDLVTQHVQFPEPILEVGSYIVKGQEELADLRSLFPQKKFVGTDMREGQGVDEVENLEYLRSEDGEVGSLICIDTLQCVRNLWKARAEMHRVLAENGILFIASAMNAPYNINYYYNYWRFTPKGFDFMMDTFPNRLMYMQGDKTNPHTIIGLAARSPAILKPLLESKFLEELKSIGDEAFYHYDVNTLHAEMLAKDKNQAHNI